MLDLKVAPSFGTRRVIVVDDIVSVQVPEVLMVSVPPDESVHPLMVGGTVAFMVSDAGLGTLPVAVNVVHETVIGTESMSPLKVTFVPVFSFAVIVVPAGGMRGCRGDAERSAPAPRGRRSSWSVSTWLGVPFLVLFLVV